MICKIPTFAMAAMFSMSPPTAMHVSGTASRDPSAIFAAMKAASGGAAWDGIAEIDYDADTDQGGQHGHTQVSQDLRNGRAAAYYDMEGERSGEGFDGRHSWLIDEKNLVSIRESAQTARQSPTDRYIARNGWFDAVTAQSARFEFVASQREHERDFLILRIAPKGGAAFEVWLDASSHLLDRVVQHGDSGDTTTTYYSDYRAESGVLLAHTQRSSNGEAQYDSVTHVRHYAVLRHADDAHFVMPISSAHDAQIAAGADSAIVPFELYAGLVLVNVSIDGAPPLPFILDTGGLNLLTPDAARQLGIAGAGNQAVRGAGEAVQSMQTAQVKAYTLGAVTLQEQRFLIVDLPRLLTDRGTRTPIAGLLGYELLRRFATRIDYDRLQLTFVPSATFHYQGSGVRLPIVFDDRTPQVKARVDGVEGSFSLDSGDAGELTVFGPFAAAHGIAASGATLAVQARGVGGKTANSLTRLRSFSLGPYSVSRPLTTFAAPKAGEFASSVLAGNIGHGILSRFAVTFDYAQHQIFLERGRDFAQLSPGDRSGLGFDRTEHDSFVIATVAAKSPAADAGLEPGDVVTSIDGVRAGAMSLDDLKRVAQRPAGTAITLATQRAGIPRQVTLVLAQDLLP
ncbi:PDZ domain-containing protein [Pseudolysobacter antarcticus]|uniref:PDZ domain-containing protein n=1 Tax=Pseudolysobacter antarcticus TaxID=2511995 RepID=A0A411HHI9_9GAMM|nr:aspartyl protease family protein [Pseudolysobacter antarcticus]QBB69989.1 PDZ domain-containing protein [Pseudolysobacter antarcticus]